MELIYSTSDLKHAERLASALTQVGLANHVSGAHSARLTGFLAARTPSAIGVWLASASDLPRAREIMKLHGYLPDTPAKSTSVVKHRPAWLIAIIAVVIAGLALLLAGGP